MNAFYKTAETLRQGAMTLPGKYYTDPNIFNLEIENIFAKSWLCCGRCDEISNPGQYKLVTIYQESIILLRDENNMLQAFYNVCRHRGTQLCVKLIGFKQNQCCAHRTGCVVDINNKVRC